MSSGPDPAADGASPAADDVLDGERATAAPDTGLFDLSPTSDQRMLIDVVREFAIEGLRPAASEADESCAPPVQVLLRAARLGVAGVGLPASLGGLSDERSAMTGTLVAEALAHGDMGLALAVLAPGSVATALALWGTRQQQGALLPSITGEAALTAALALTEPTVLFDAWQPRTHAVRDVDGYLLTGEKSLVPRGSDAALFVVGAQLDGRPALFLVGAPSPGLRVEPEPAMGVRAAGLARVTLNRVRVPTGALLGDAEGVSYAECVRLSRLAWCALAVGTGQAVLDHVTAYVNERVAFGAPISHRQSVAFCVANLAIELQSMRLLTYRAASRASRKVDFAREVGLARTLCVAKGMQIGLDGVQLLGGHGYVKEHPVERWYRDLRSLAVMEGGVLV